ncbi:hypothetical protein Poli38472_011895 [Pythium oligandrum]|uniref:Uncharacterized protein n=1 Tax=Pythium oligandrum TaxID=41045 RepID=A0A8K1FG39_PYTOL|nr:hypothetical protein Poli38472_011895 [Pythium oligandrum]|eukprot:TMW58307.1 hypothetical protein Poli38472_011895 [Pythium oligandrum]
MTTIHAYSQYDRVVAVSREIEQLQRLEQWARRFVDFQLQWLACSERIVDTDAALRLWNRLHDVLARVLASSDPQQQLSVFQDELPKCVSKATRLAALTSSVSSSLLQDTLDPALYPERVKRTHQWVPSIVADVYKDVEDEFASGRSSEALTLALRRVMTVIRDQNPYNVFQVLYRPPPEVTQSLWRLRDSSQVRAIAAVVHAYVRSLEHLHRWMKHPTNDFWGPLHSLVYHTRRCTVVFHHVMLALYAVAMGRLDPTFSLRDFHKQIDDGIQALDSHDLKTELYGLAPELKSAADPVVRETYRYCPEWLVFVDKWRWEHKVVEYGFASTGTTSDRVAHEYEVNPHNWRDAKVWHKIKRCLKAAIHTWWSSDLGTARFREWSFQELGAFEHKMKNHFRGIINMFYKQNLAKWTQQRYQYSRARQLQELQIMRPPIPVVLDPPRTQDHKIEQPQQIKPSTARFRGPTQLRRRQQPPSNGLATDSLRENLVTLRQSQLQDMAEITEDAIFRWTDDEIDAHEQEKQRIFDLQTSLLALQDVVKLPGLLHPPTADQSLDPVECTGKDTSAQSVLNGWRRVRSISKQVMVGEKRSHFMVQRRC